MSKLEPAPLKFPNGGGLRAMAQNQGRISKLEHEKIDLRAKLAKSKTTDPDELRQIDLETEIAQSKVRTPKPMGFNPSKKEPKPTIVSNKPLKGI